MDDVVPATSASCRLLAQIAGPEDFAVDRLAGRLLVSSQDRRQPRQRGNIVSVFANGRSHVLPLRGRSDCSFHPHGVSLVQANDHQRLYVVNHHDAVDATADRDCFSGTDNGTFRGRVTSVEVYRVAAQSLTFLQRLAQPKVLTNGNDLVADEDGNVYVTAPPAGALGTLMDLSDWRWRPEPSRIVSFRCNSLDAQGICTSGQWSELARLGGFVNGIALQRSKSAEEPRRLLISSTIGGDLFQLIEESDRWRRGPNPKRPFASGHDNLMWTDETQTALLVASHPDLRRFLQHARSSRVPSPSQVWRIPLAEEDGQVVRIFDDSGGRISAASTAACFGGSLFLGQVFGDEVLQCQAPGLCPAGKKSGAPEQPELSEEAGS